MSDENLTSEERIAVREFVEKVGDQKAAVAMKTDIGSLLRVLADRPIRRGTILLVKAWFKTKATAK